MLKHTQAVILAGDGGTRLGPLTREPGETRRAVRLRVSLRRFLELP